MKIKIRHISILVIILLSGLSACKKMADTYDWLGVVSWSYDKKKEDYEEKTDTVKNSLKVKMRKSGNVPYLGRRAYNLTSFEADKLVADFSKGAWQIDGIPLETGVPISVEGKDEITVRLMPSPASETPYEIKFYSDEEGEKITTTYKVFAFDNLRPQASLSIKRIDNLIYELDVSKSYDPDEKFGGGLEAYIFTITEVKSGERESASFILPHDVDISRNKKEYSFPNEAEYEVQVEVKDRDGGVDKITKILSTKKE